MAGIHVDLSEIQLCGYFKRNQTLCQYHIYGVLQCGGKLLKWGGMPATTG
jgi:hypothetical protein